MFFNKKEKKLSDYELETIELDDRKQDIIKYYQKLVLDGEEYDIIPEIRDNKKAWVVYKLELRPDMWMRINGIYGSFLAPCVDFSSMYHGIKIAKEYIGTANSEKQAKDFIKHVRSK